MLPNLESILIEMMAHRNHISTNKVVQRFTHKHYKSKLICIYLLSLNCNLFYAEIGKLFKLKASNIGHRLLLFLEELDNNHQLSKELEYYNKLIA